MMPKGVGSPSFFSYFVYLCGGVITVIDEVKGKSVKLTDLPFAIFRFVKDVKRRNKIHLIF